MADIDIEKRERMGWWWWLLGLIIIAFIIYLLAGTFNDRGEVAVDETVTSPPATEAVPPMEPAPGMSRSAASERFIQDCAAPATSGMSIDHQHTSSCAQNLVAAIDGLVPANELETLGLTDEMAEARSAASRLATNPQDVEHHAQMTREAFTSITDVIEDLQEERYPELKQPVEQLSDAADAVRSNRALADQSTQVQQFFTQAGDVLRRMMDGTVQPGSA